MWCRNGPFGETARLLIGHVCSGVVTDANAVEVDTTLGRAAIGVGVDRFDGRWSGVADGGRRWCDIEKRVTGPS